MKLPKMKKLPSGTWRMQLQLEGERFSITDKDPKVVKQKARDIVGGNGPEKRIGVTVGESIDKYIAYREPRLSPSTIYGYMKYRRLYLQSIMDIDLNLLTQKQIDDAIMQDEENGLSPKTVKNAHGLLTATLKKYRPKFHADSSLPEKEDKEPLIPTEDDLKKIWAEAMKDIYEPHIFVAILLASWIGLRMSEILAIRFSDLDGMHANIKQAMVAGKNGDVIKGPKTKAGWRRIKFPKELIDLIDALPNKSDDAYIVPCHRATVNRRFNTICDRAGVPRCRMHDLRHFSASEALSLNIPNKYQMKRMGHKTDIMLKTVYQHVMRDKEDGFADILDNQMSIIYFNALTSHAASHEKEKAM